MNVTERGPLFTTVIVQAEAPGCNSLTMIYRLNDALDRVEIYDNLDKQKVLTPEAVHFAFPVNVPSGTMRYDLAYGYCRPELDQLPGSNKNFLAMEHWLDISDENSGVTLICPDVPLFEAGRITMDELVYGWVDSIPPTQTFLSYVMNNYWETNYAASQEGTCTFRYVIRPHEGFDPAMAEKEAIGQRQPLLTRKGGGWQKEKQSLLALKNDALILTSLKPVGQGKKFLITVYNAGVRDEVPLWETPLQGFVLSDPDGISEYGPGEGIVIPPGGIRYFKVSVEE
jgi:alpha-mannosidase